MNSSLFLYIMLGYKQITMAYLIHGAAGNSVLCVCVFPELPRKQCVRTYSAYDFLIGVVNKVPNLGGMEPCEGETRIGHRR